MRGTIVLVMALAAVGCKRDADRLLPETAPDGKAMVDGCVWFIGKGDDLAFCDDGRVCVRDKGAASDDFRCVVLAPRVTCPACPSPRCAPPPAPNAGALEGSPEL